jgi:hypothetical protein
MGRVDALDWFSHREPVVWGTMTRRIRTSLSRALVAGGVRGLRAVQLWPAVRAALHWGGAVQAFGVEHFGRTDWPEWPALWPGYYWKGRRGGGGYGKSYPVGRFHVHVKHM